MASHHPYISVVIPAINEEKYISNVFEGLGSQTFKDFETIVVDGGSKDKTRDIARKHATIIIEKKRGTGRARNAGADIAKGDILVFIDADTKPSKALLRAYAKAFNNNNIVAATGPILPLEKDSSFAIRFGYGFVTKYILRLAMAFGRPSIVGSNFAVRKEAFEKADGFDVKMLTYEDWDLSNRLKKFGKIAYINEAIVETSTRRVVKWGIVGYTIFYIEDMIRYHLFKKTKSNYKQIR